MTTFVLPSDEFLDAAIEQLNNHMTSVAKTENEQFPKGVIILGYDSDEAKELKFDGKSNGKLEVRIWFKEGWPKGERYVVKIKSVVDGFADGAGYSGFSISGSLTRKNGEIVSDFSGYVNKHESGKFHGW